jgi:hypothetical protein
MAAGAPHQLAFECGDLVVNGAPNRQQGLDQRPQLGLLGAVSPKGFVLSNRERLGDIVEVPDQASSQRHRLGAAAGTLWAPTSHLLQPASQSFVDDILQSGVTSGAHPLQQRRNVGI